MDDWRLRDQAEYLRGETLYKVAFPSFWQKAYAERNVFYRMIFSSAHRFVEQTGRSGEYLEGEQIRHFWHAHCAFCWEKVTTDQECEFYCTKDMQNWICPECFGDFRDSFAWTIQDSSELEE